jgi:hypothetical protein
MTKSLIDHQMEICAKFGSPFKPPELGAIVGVSSDFFSGTLPLNGLRHPETQGTTGWYLWAGEELSQAADYFGPMHTRHLCERGSELLPYLALAPGWRFLVAGDYEDAWYDESLLDV